VAALGDVSVRINRPSSDVAFDNKTEGETMIGRDKVSGHERTKLCQTVHCSALVCWAIADRGCGERVS